MSHILFGCLFTCVLMNKLSSFCSVTENECVLHVFSKTHSNNYNKNIILIMIRVIHDLLRAASDGLKICIHIKYEIWQ